MTFANREIRNFVVVKVCNYFTSEETNFDEQTLCFLSSKLAIHVIIFDLNSMLQSDITNPVQSSEE